jgi:hypothetical protein
MVIKRYIFILMLAAGCIACQGQFNLQQKESKVDGPLLKLSQQLLLAAKTKEATDSLVKRVSNISLTGLEIELQEETNKKAFWINIYNSFTQIILMRKPGKYKNRRSFFATRQINVGGRNLSLDDIEHGILRRSKVKWSLGYLNKLFPSSFEKKMRVNKVDYRIHFTLNCGAMSCPAIAFYSSDQLDKQLELATSVYLQGECEYNEESGKVWVPAIMGWFRHDFGGKRGMIYLLKQQKIIPGDSNPAIKFKKYNWNMFLENYKN